MASRPGNPRAARRNNREEGWHWFVGDTKAADEAGILFRGHRIVVGVAVAPGVVVCGGPAHCPSCYERRYVGASAAGRDSDETASGEFVRAVGQTRPAGRQL